MRFISSGRHRAAFWQHQPAICRYLKEPTDMLVYGVGKAHHLAHFVFDVYAFNIVDFRRFPRLRDKSGQVRKNNLSSSCQTRICHECRGISTQAVRCG